ncbi:MAG: tape measure protein [Chloroflexi bacterium]|nr:tape measure protein [Chloroflexota bacterium]
MAASQELLVLIRAQDEASATLSKVQKSVRGLGDFMADAVGPSKVLLGGMTALGAGLGGVGIQAVRMAGDLEQTRAGWTTLLGSAEEADAFLSQLDLEIGLDPFGQGLREATKQLAAFGFETDTLIPTVKIIGDQISALGGTAEDVQQATDAIGRMRLAGEATTEDLNTLQQMGIPAWQNLAEAAGLSVGELRDRVSEHAISSDQALEAIFGGMQARTEGAMAGARDTVLGAVSALQNTVAITMMTIGNTIIENLDLKDRLNALGDNLKTFTDTLKEGGFAAVWEELVPDWVKTAIPIVAGAIAGALVPAIVAMGIALAGALIHLAPFMAIGALIAVVWGDDIVAAFERAGGAIGIMEAIGSRFSEIGNVLSFLGPVIQAVLGFFGGLFAYIEESLATIFSFTEAWKLIGIVLGTVVAAAATVLVVAITAVVVVLAAIVTAIGIVIAIIQVLALGIAALIDWFSGLGDRMGATGQAIGSLASAVGSAANSMVSALGSAISQIMANYASWIAFGGQVMSAFGTLTSSIVSGAGEFAGAVGRAVGDAVSSLGSLASGAISAMGSFAGAIGSGISELLSTVGGLAGQLFSAGQQAVQSLVNGLRSISIPTPHFSTGVAATLPGGIEIPSVEFAGWYQRGGIVPGRPNQAMLAMVHGGERVIPHGAAAGGATIVVNVQGSVLSERDLVEVVRAGLLRQGRSLSSLGFS